MVDQGDEALIMVRDAGGRSRAVVRPCQGRRGDQSGRTRRGRAWRWRSPGPGHPGDAELSGRGGTGCAHAALSRATTPASRSAGLKTRRHRSSSPPAACSSWHDRGSCHRGEKRGATMDAHRKRQPPPLSRRLRLNGRIRAGRAGAARIGLGAGRSWRRARPVARSTRACTSASSPTARSSSSRTGPRWAPASARRCRSSRPTSSMPTGAASASSRASATPRYGDQNTDGSRSVRDFYDAFRQAGASARSDAGRAPRRRSGACRPRECSAAEPRGRAPAERPPRWPSARSSPAAAKLPVPQRRDAAVQAEDALEVRRQGDGRSTT